MVPALVVYAASEGGGWRSATPRVKAMNEKIRKSDAEWRSALTSEQYYVTRKKGTEPPFTGEYEETETEGTYVCVCCGQPLFSSDAKYHSGSGWPSYYQPIAAENIEM